MTNSPIQFTHGDIFKMEASVERLGGLVAAAAAYQDRVGERELGDLLRLGLEDVRLMRELLIEKGAVRRPLCVASNLAESAVRATLANLDAPIPAFITASEPEESRAA